MSVDISVVIPLYNANSYLADLLQALEKQTFDLSRFEVILVDDCSIDDTQKIAENSKASSQLNLQLVWRTTNGGVSATRNTGWQKAQAPLILFIDQDCVPDEQLLAMHFSLHTQHANEQIAVAGRIVWSADYKENPASEHFKAGYFPFWDKYAENGSNFQLFITSNASVAKKALLEIGGFNEAFRHNYEDVACGYCLEKAGYRIILCPEAVVQHNRALPVAEMFRRNFVAGREMMRFFQHYPELVGHWFLLNPAQALDWGYRLATIDSLLDTTLEVLNNTNLATLQPFLTEAANYLLKDTFLHYIDTDYLDLYVAQKSYQQLLKQVQWLEILLKTCKKVSRSFTTEFLTHKINKLLYNKKYQSRNLKISVLTFYHDEIEWQKFVQCLATQTFPHDKFELVVGVENGTKPSNNNLPFATRQIKTKVWQELAEVAKGDLLVILPTYCQPAFDLLEVYARHYALNRILVGQNFPLGNINFDRATLEIPPNYHFSDELRPLHYINVSLDNIAIPTKLYRTNLQLFDPRFTGKIADLLVGWKLANSHHAELLVCPRAISYTLQSKRLAHQLLDFNSQPQNLEKLELYYPKLAELYNIRQQHHETSPQSPELTLLYDIIKEYPLACGMLEGLKQFFDLQSYNDLQNQPLFATLYKEWQTERKQYFQAQLNKVKLGKIELENYQQKVETACRTLSSNFNSLPDASNNR